MVIWVVCCVEEDNVARGFFNGNRGRPFYSKKKYIIFRNVPIASLPRALSSLQAAVGPGVSLLDIRVPVYRLEAACVPSLLHAAAALSPIDFNLALPRDLYVDLSRFRRATSIELNVASLRLTPPRPSGGGFPALERLTLSLKGSCFHLAALVLACPCLRVLWVSGASLYADGGINIRSESL